jgi:hypothetical protein
LHGAQHKQHENGDAGNSKEAPHEGAGVLLAEVFALSGVRRQIAVDDHPMGSPAVIVAGDVICDTWHGGVPQPAFC